MLDKLLGSIFDFASTPRGLLSILAGFASAEDRRRDTPAYGGGVSYGMQGPRRLEAVKGLGRYADVMGFSNGGQTVDIRQPLRYGLAQGPYGPLLAYDIPSFAPASAPAPAPEAPRQTQATEASGGYEGIGELSDYMKNETFEQQSARNAKLNDYATNIVASWMALSPTALAVKGLGNAAQYGLGKFLNSRPGAIRTDPNTFAPVTSRDSLSPESIAGIAESLGVTPQDVSAAISAGNLGTYGLTPGEMSAILGGGSYNEMGGGGGGDGGYGAGTVGYDAGDMAHDSGSGAGAGASPDGETREYSPFARGGSVRSFPMQDGGFVMTKRAVDGAGGPRGIAQLLPNARMIRGPGTGTSDSIPATIQGRNGVTPAKVSNGESYVPPEGVEQAGGAQALYNLMNNLQRRA
jgi:hypothetical protein